MIVVRHTGHAIQVQLFLITVYYKNQYGLLGQYEIGSMQFLFILLCTNGYSCCRRMSLKSLQARSSILYQEIGSVHMVLRYVFSRLWLGTFLKLDVQAVVHIIIHLHAGFVMS